MKRKWVIIAGLAVLLGLAVYYLSLNGNKPVDRPVSTAGLESNRSKATTQKPVSVPGLESATITNFNEQILVPSVGRFIGSVRKKGVYFPFETSQMRIERQAQVEGGVVTQFELGPYSMSHDYTTNHSVEAVGLSFDLVPCNRVIGCSLNKRLPFFSLDYFNSKTKQEELSQIFGWDGQPYYEQGVATIKNLAEELNVRKDDLEKPIFVSQQRAKYEYLIMGHYSSVHTPVPNKSSMPIYSYDLLAVTPKGLAKVFGSQFPPPEGNVFILWHFSEYDAAFPRPRPKARLPLQPASLKTQSGPDNWQPDPQISGIAEGQVVTNWTAVTLSEPENTPPYRTEVLTYDAKGNLCSHGTFASLPGRRWINPARLARGPASLYVESRVTPEEGKASKSGDYPLTRKTIHFTNDPPITVEDYCQYADAGTAPQFSFNSTGSLSNAAYILTVRDEKTNLLYRTRGFFVNGHARAGWDGTSNGVPYNSLGHILAFALTPDPADGLNARAASNNPVLFPVSFGRRPGQH